MDFLHGEDGSASVFCPIVSGMFDEDAPKETGRPLGDFLLLEEPNRPRKRDAIRALRLRGIVVVVLLTVCRKTRILTPEGATVPANVEWDQGQMGGGGASG